MTDSEFRHEVTFYDSAERFLAETVPFVTAALEAGEPTLVAVGAEKIELLQGELGADAERVRFADIEELGHNPARIIPAWRRFVDEHVTASGQARGIGEPIWPGRSDPEIDECQRHEALLNLAFGGAPAWSLLCPYDIRSLDDEVLEMAAQSHPYLAVDGAGSTNRQCRGHARAADPFAGRFDPGPAGARELSFDRDGLHDLRELVAAEGAGAAAFSPARTTDLGARRQRARRQQRPPRWAAAVPLAVAGAGDAGLVEVTDRGQIEEPLVGRSAAHAHPGGRPRALDGKSGLRSGADPLRRVGDRHPPPHEPRRARPRLSSKKRRRNRRLFPPTPTIRMWFRCGPGLTPRSPGH